MHACMYVFVLDTKAWQTHRRHKHGCIALGL